MRWLTPLLTRLSFSGPHMRPVRYGALLPWLLLLGYRSWLCSQAVDALRLEDHWEVNLGDLEFWWAWAGGWALGLSLADPDGSSRWAWALRGLQHVLVAVFFGLTALDLQYWSVTGSRADWDAAAVLWRDLPMFWPVVASEFRWYHLLIVMAALIVSLAPAIWRGRPLGRWRPALYLLFVPILWMEVIDTRPGAVASVKLLQASFSEHMYWDWVERAGDVSQPPDPARLEPLVLARGPDWRPFNIVMVLMESVSADRTTLHRPDLPTTPNLVALAQRGLSVVEMNAVVPHTSKSLVSILCGRYPRLTTEVSEARPGGLPGRCLPELLSEQGYRTAFFQTARETFEDRFRLIHNLRFGTFLGRDALPLGFEKVNYFGVEDQAMLEPGLDWSAEEPGRPFFATYLTLTSHHNYGVPEDWPRQEYGEGVNEKSWKQLDAIRYVDDFVGKLVAGYRARGLDRDTLFVILGDHGEAFGEHGRSQHDLIIWQEGLHIPAVLAGTPLEGRPEIAARGTITGVRSQLDLVPSLLGLLGLEVVSGWLDGSTLFRPAPDRVLYHSCWRSHRCIARRSGERKFIEHYREKSPQYFGLDEDPAERDNRAKKLEPDQIRFWQQELHDWRAQNLGYYEAIDARFFASFLPDDRPAIRSWGATDDPAVPLIDALDCALEAASDPVSAVAGSALWARCTWRARAPIREGWEVRVRIHHTGADPVTGQAIDRTAEDTWFPLDGRLPTWRWEPGQGVPDAIRLPIPPDFPAGAAEAAITWRRLGGRLLERDEGGEWLPLGTVQIRARGGTPLPGEVEPDEDGP